MSYHTQLEVDQTWIDQMVNLFMNMFLSKAVKSIPASISPPPLTKFIARVVRLTKISLPVFAMAHIYLTRLMHTPLFRLHTTQITMDTPHRLFLASILIASKIGNDTLLYRSGQSIGSPSLSALHVDMTPTYLATICDGLYTVQEITVMERLFCQFIEYQCWVTPQQLMEHVRKVGETSPLSKVQGRLLLSMLSE